MSYSTLTLDVFLSLRNKRNDFADWLIEHSDVQEVESMLEFGFNEMGHGYKVDGQPVDREEWDIGVAQAWAVFAPEEHVCYAFNKDSLC